MNMKARIVKNIKEDWSTGCWEWLLACTPKGYGRISVGGRRTHAHRESYREFVGPIPVGAMVCHSCDNRKCVAPHHLFLGDAQDNSDDMVKKGRSRSSRSGEKNPNAKLTAAQVEKLRSLEGKRSARQISEDWSISTSTVYQIWSGKTWAE